MAKISYHYFFFRNITISRFFVMLILLLCLRSTKTNPVFTILDHITNKHNIQIKQNSALFSRLTIGIFSRNIQEMNEQI